MQHAIRAEQIVFWPGHVMKETWEEKEDETDPYLRIREKQKKKRKKKGDGF